MDIAEMTDGTMKGHAAEAACTARRRISDAKGT
jgi:hypothetical protein